MCLTTAQISFAAENLVVDGNVTNDFVRIMLYAEPPPQIEAILNDNNDLTINLDRSFITSFSNLLTKTKQNILKAAINENGDIITLSLDKTKKYRTRKFESDNFSGIDIIFIANNKENIADKEAQDKRMVDKVNPKTGDNEIKDKLTNNQDTQVKPDNADSAKKAINKKIEEPVTVKDNIVKNGLQLIFPWRGEVAASVFLRDKILWIVFNKKIYVDINDIKHKNSNLILDIQDIVNPQNTILAISLNKDININVYKDKYNWVVEQVKEEEKLLNSIAVITKERSTKGPHVFLPLKRTTDFLRIIDPFIGDIIIIMPLFDNSSGIIRDYKKTDFTLLKTNQGIALNLINDNATLEADRKGIYIGMPSIDLFGSGIKDKTQEAEKKEKLQKSEPDEKKITENYKDVIAWLDLSDLTGLKPDMAFKNISELNYKNIMSKDNNTKFNDLFQIARINFYRKMYLESATIIEYAIENNKELSPAIYNDAYFLQAISYYMDNRLFAARDAINKINDTVLTQNRKEELHFWKSVINAQIQEENNEGYDYITYASNFISVYPYNIRYILALKKLELSLDAKTFSTRSAIDIKDLETSQKLIQILHDESTLLKEQRDYVDYLAGLYFLRKGDRQRALEIWQKINPSITNRYNRAVIKFALITLQLRENRISNKDAIDELEKLNLLWRGDEIEKEILELLGQILYEDDQYIEAIRTWQVLLKTFPGTKSSILATQKMSKTFIELYNEGAIDKYDIIKALSFYNEFKEFTPIGREGDIMIQNLANKLIEADLLDRAAALLEYQIRYRLVGNQKAIIATRLALLYLIDNLPKKVEEIMNLSDDLPMSNVLKRKRNIIKAHAYVIGKEYDKALLSISYIYNQEALKVRSEVYWRTQNWEELIKLLEPYFIKRDLSPDPLTRFEKNQLIRLSAAYSNNQQYISLRRLFLRMDKFLNDDSPEAKIFNFIGNGNTPISSYDINGTTGLVEIESFLDTYRNSVIYGGLDTILPDLIK